MTESPEMVTTKQAAEMLGVPYQTFYHRVIRGYYQIDSIKPGKNRLFLRRDIVRIKSEEEKSSSGDAA